MFAGEIYAPESVRLVDIELSDARVSAGSDEPKILFEPKLACLCGSDLLFYERTYPEFMPSIGQSLHEMIGTVIESESGRFAAGECVLAVPYEHFGFYERYWVAESRAIRVDTRPVPGEALMAQPLGTVLYALKKLPSLIDRDVAVMGQGPMGLLFTAALQNLGARTVIGVDPVAERRQLSLRMGANHALDSATEDIPSAIAELTDGKGAEFVIEAVGHREQVLGQCVSSCCQDGTVLFFGVPTDRLDDVPMREMFMKNLRLLTSVHPDFRRDFPLAMQWIAEKRIDVSPMITHSYPLSDIQPAFELFHHKRDGAAKVLIDMESR